MKPRTTIQCLRQQNPDVYKPRNKMTKVNETQGRKAFHYPNSLGVELCCPSILNKTKQLRRVKSFAIILLT